MRRALLFLCIVISFAGLLFLAWPKAKNPGDGTRDAGARERQTGPTTALRRDPLQPELAEASAILRIEKSGNVSEADLSTALAGLLERPQLDEVSARLALGTAWSMDAEQTAQRLAKILKVSPIDNGGSGIIRASDASPVMAASLANTAASVLRDHLERSASETTRLEKQIADQREMVDDKRKLLATIIRTGKVIYESEKEAQAEDRPEAVPEPQAGPPPDEGTKYIDAKGDFERATQELSRREDQHREVKKVTIHHILWAEAKVGE